MTAREMAVPSISPLRGAADRARFGGKAAHLADLLSAGFPVPDGFAIAHDADESMPETLASLRAELARVGDAALAVRSSAVDEDGAEASAAGIYESVLDVRGEQAALDAISAVRASARTERARAYRADGAPARMAVVVQRLVHADVSGVLFTADPLTGDRDTRLVTAVPGLGEALVSGERSGEQWEVRGTNARRARALEAPILSDAQVRAVAQLGDRIAARAGRPQDIEWAIAGGRIEIVQARPMTALPEVVTWNRPHRGGVWMRSFRWGEWLSDPVSPLFASWLLPRAEGAFVLASGQAGIRLHPPIHAVVNGWYYHSSCGTKGILSLFLGMLRRIPRFTFAFMKAPSDPVSAEPIVAAPFRRHYDEHLLPRHHRLAAEVVADDPAAEMAYVDRVCDLHGELMFNMTMVAGFAWKAEAALAKFFRKHLRGVEGAPQELLSGLAPVPACAPHFACSLDWMHPTAGELGVAGNTPVERAAPARRREDLERACQQRVPAKLREPWAAMLAVARTYAVVREEQARSLTLTWPQLRAALRRLGERARAAGAIDRVDDVFWLVREELTEALGGVDVRHAVAERRARWQQQRRLVAPLVLGKLPGPMAKMSADFERDLRGDARKTKDAVVVGMPASAGRASGVVRVVRSPEDFARFAAGDVLVASSTAPAWTPLFARAAAVVTDGGSIVAHASLVAREYGIPAVVGTGNATTRLRDGQHVVVDGTQGLVELALVPGP